jgi:uncharacterized protein YnzC (UPF0291/DUF896 family)
MNKKEIELNIIYWLFRKAKEQGLTEEEKHELQKLCDKYPNESFIVFNFADGFLKVKIADGLLKVKKV